MLKRALLLYRNSSQVSVESCWLSTLVDSAQAQRNRLSKYEEERRRQVGARTLSIEKAIVSVITSQTSESRKLLMNNHSSTYFDCIKHISKHLTERTALVGVKDAAGTQFLPVHSTIDGNSEFRCISFNDPTEDVEEVNKAYWRSCAFLLGAIAESSFRNEVVLKNPHPPNYETGRFGYSAVIKELKDWEVSQEELNVLTRACFQQYIDAGLPFEPLTVSRDVAVEIFEGNPYKQEAVASSAADTVTVYKLGEHVDITDGPLIANTRQIGRFAITKIKGVSDLYGFYGVSIPAIQNCSSFSWELIVASSKNDSLKGTTDEAVKR